MSRQQVAFASWQADSWGTSRRSVQYNYLRVLAVGLIVPMYAYDYVIIIKLVTVLMCIIMIRL